jgi:D-alanine-D-alanine ligase
MTLGSQRKIRVAVICGGTSSEREVSLQSGKQVIEHLDRSLYEPRYIEIAKNGQWLLKDTQTPLQIDIAQPDDHQIVLSTASGELDRVAGDHPFDIAFIALHGSFGEDGRIQALLDLLNIPYTGSSVLASALCMNKAQTRNQLRGIGIAMPDYFIVQHRSTPTLEQLDERICKEMNYPCIVKPNESGSSIGITLVESKDALADALSFAFAEDETILIEQFIKGREITCGVLGNSSIGGDLQALPPVEIFVDGVFFDYNAKYHSKQTKELCPAPLDEKETEEVKHLALQIHSRIGCDGLSRSDFILRDGTFYYLETNTVPGLTEQSLCPKEAAAAGFTFERFLGIQIELAMEKFRTVRDT